jgi:hypothetical protein
VDILDLLVTFHSFWRYAVVIAAVVAIVGALGGWFGSLPARETARRAGLLYIIALDVQVLVGIVLWIGKGWYAVPGYFRAEHPATMLLAMIVAHVGQVLSRRAKTPRGAARAVAIAVAISLVLVIVGIPGVVRGG